MDEAYSLTDSANERTSNKAQINSRNQSITIKIRKKIKM